MPFNKESLEGLPRGHMRLLIALDVSAINYKAWVFGLTRHYMERLQVLKLVLKLIA